MVVSDPDSDEGDDDSGERRNSSDDSDEEEVVPESRRKIRQLPEIAGATDRVRGTAEEMDISSSDGTLFGFLLTVSMFLYQNY